MRSFREEYQKEIDQAGTFHLDVKRVSDEIHHHKMRNARRRRMMVSVASAAAVFLLVGGMATAMNYGGGFIQVRHNGFSITNQPGGDMESAEGAVDAGQTPALAKERSRQAVEESDEPAAQCIVYDLEPTEYDSLEAFWEETHVTVPMPDMQLLGGDTAEQYIHMLGNQVYIRVQDTEERSFSIIQADHRGDQAYASSSAYSGEAANERNYTTAQGYTYKVIDIVDDCEINSIECAISLYGRDLLVGFRGYTQEEAYEVLQGMDLGVYTTDE